MVDEISSCASPSEVTTRSSNVPVSPVASVKVLEPTSTPFNLAVRVPDSEPSISESVFDVMVAVVAYLVTAEPVAIPTPV